MLNPATAAPRSGRPWAVAAGLFVVFALLAHGPGLRAPFLGDDYVFLDRARGTSLAWVFTHRATDFEWYRPWSREVHFWTLLRTFGPHPVWFRIVNLALWAGALGLYGWWLARIAGQRIAALAVSGVAALALWGTPLAWISGSQDLWMLVFGMGVLVAWSSGRRVLATLALLLALLSKETAAVLPVVVLAYHLLLERMRPLAAIIRCVPLWVVTTLWLVLHPTLLTRLIQPPTTNLELGVHRHSHPVTLLKTLLATVNLDVFPRPADFTFLDGVRILAAALVVGVGLWFAMRGAPRGGDPERTRLAWFGAGWAVAAWLPLFTASVGWHAYYAGLGTLGAWLAIAVGLERAGRRVLPVMMLLVVLGGVHAMTPSWDWGNVWYQQRAGRILEQLRLELQTLHPALPPHARVYLARVPNNVGLIAGQSPALRIWYGDPSLESGFYSTYRRRYLAEVPGEDYFFKLDTLRGLIEVRTGPEDVLAAARENPEWERDHLVLTTLLMRHGEFARAGTEFEKLSRLPGGGRYALYAAVNRLEAGDAARADSLYGVASRALGVSRSMLDSVTVDLRRGMHTATPAP